MILCVRVTTGPASTVSESGVTPEIRLDRESRRIDIDETSFRTTDKATLDDQMLDTCVKLCAFIVTKRSTDINPSFIDGDGTPPLPGEKTNPSHRASTTSLKNDSPNAIIESENEGQEPPRLSKPGLPPVSPSKIEPQPAPHEDPEDSSLPSGSPAATQISLPFAPDTQLIGLQPDTVLDIGELPNSIVFYTN